MADKSVGAVLLAVPNDLHAPYAYAAAEAGKHILCEKPVAMSSAEAEKMYAAAEKAGVLFEVHQNRRWDDDFLTVRKLAESGVIGSVYKIESRVTGGNGIPGGWRKKRAQGGGMLLDWGVHLIDQLMYLVDSPVVEVYAHLLSVKFPGVDDNFKLMMRFRNGLSALVEVDTYTFINLPRWHVSGDAGTMQIDDFSCTGRIVRARTEEMHWEQGIVYTVAGPTRTMAPRPK